MIPPVVPLPEVADLAGLPVPDASAPGAVPRTGRAGRLARLAARIGVLLAVAWAAHALVVTAMEVADTLPEALRGPAQLSVLVAALALYAALIAIPFVPGVEIGVTLLVLQGAAVAPFVYAATCLGLSLAFLAGRALPEAMLRAAFADLRLARASALLDQIAVLGPDRRLALLRGRLPDWLGPHVVRYRYLALAGALNLPGNAVLGGGGGLCLVAGVSRVFCTRETLLTIALAIAPVPLAVWSLGPGILGR